FVSVCTGKKNSKLEIVSTSHSYKYVLSWRLKKKNGKNEKEKKLIIKRKGKMRKEKKNDKIKKKRKRKKQTFLIKKIIMKEKKSINEIWQQQITMTKRNNEKMNIDCPRFFFGLCGEDIEVDNAKYSMDLMQQIMLYFLLCAFNLAAVLSLT
ncbi:hypothetical protein RFI_31862, partial [Reticulomyxa filosa]